MDTTDIGQLVADQFPFVLGAIDMNYKYIWFNKAFQQTAKKRGSLLELGDDAREIIEKLNLPQEDIDKLIKYWDDSLKGKTIKLIEKFGHPGDEEIYEITYAPLYNQGTQVGAYLHSKHITEYEEEIIKLKQKAEDATIAKNNFLSRVSHELRTPLNSIVGFSQMLDMNLGQYLDEDNQGNIQEIIKQSQFLIQMVNDIMDISKMETSNIMLEMKSILLYSIVAEQFELFKENAIEKGVTIEFVPNGMDVYIKADKQRFNQVLNNLINNAIKYNKIGGKVIISAIKENDKIGIQIQDTGVGIEKELIPLLFSPFEIPNIPSVFPKRIGLGLALVKRLVDFMEGDIGVRSEVGVGSTFTVFFPIVDYVNVSIPEEPQILKPDVQKSILYIEDNISNYNLVNQITNQYTPFKMLSTVQGELGYQLAIKHQPNLILLDLNLPDIDGSEVMEKLKNDDRTAHIPVIVISADGNKPKVEKMIAMGAKEYIVKPFNIPKFLEAVNREIL